jgi:integrase
MNPERLNGTENACNCPPATNSGVECLKTVRDVYLQIKAVKDCGQIFSALKKFAEFAKRENWLDLLLDEILERRGGFHGYLENRDYGSTTIQNYVEKTRLALDIAQKAGWQPDANISALWRVMLDDPATRTFTAFIRHFAALTDSPGDVTRAQVINLVNQQVINFEHSLLAATNRSCSFIRYLIRAGYSQVDPIRAARLDDYGIPLDKFPDELLREVERLIALRLSDSGRYEETIIDDDLEDLDLDDFSEESAKEEGRRPHRQVNVETANLLEECVCRLFGFLINIKRKNNITKLTQLFNPRVLVKYRHWLKNERKVTTGGLHTTFVPILAALRQLPDYQPQHLLWIPAFIRSLGKMPTPDEVRAKKAQRQLEFSEVKKIPELLRAKRIHLGYRKVDESTPIGRKEKYQIIWRIASLTMSELAIRWILTLPWRQRNLREMRVIGNNPNIFKSKIPDGIEIDKPAWVLAEEYKNPNAKFWLYKFSPKENKTGKTIFCVLPKHLAPILDEYLTNWRPKLVGNKNTETLFVNQRGMPMSATQFGCFISEIALRYGGKRMNPHIFRDVFAFAWLKKYPRDFVTLSLQLWHSDVETTMRHYAGKFNTSCTTEPVENFHEGLQS